MEVESESKETKQQQTVVIADAPQISSEDSKEITEQIAAEEVFPNKPIESKPAVFVEYDPKTVHQRLQNFSTLEITQRITYTKHLCIILQELNEQQLQFLDKLFSEMVKDKEQVQRALLAQIPGLIKYFSKLDKSEQKLKKHIIPLIVKMLQLPPLDIKQEAGNCLANVAYLIEVDSRGQSVLKNVLEMAHDDASQQNRIVAVQLFSKMAALFGKDLCQQFIGLEFKSLGEDPNLKVRKEAIINLPSIAKVVGQNFFKNKLFDFYQKKSKQSIWGIRKSCVDTIIQISKLCDKKTRQTQLVTIMLQFLKDTNKWVRSSSYKQLGAFIHTLKGGQINEKLIEHYIKMTSNQLNDISSDNDILYACAYNFPAVFDALGKGKWQLLLPIYTKLLKVQDKKIKKTIASSLHQISKILGQQGTKDHLFGILDKFLKDPSDEVKVEAIRHLSNILEVIDAEKRQQLVDIFMILQKDQKKWRIRECIAGQLTALAEIYSLQTVFSYLIPITFKFCSDPVSIVRTEAAGQIGSIVKKFNTQQTKQTFLPAIIENIKGFANFSKFTQRETFVTMCQSLLQVQDLADQFLPLLKELATDKIVNVRICVAKLLAHHIKNKTNLSSNPLFSEVVEAIKSDNNAEILEEFEQES